MDYVLDCVGSFQGHKFLTDRETTRSVCAANSTDAQSAVLLNALQAGRLLSVEMLHQFIDDATQASPTARNSRVEQTT